MCQIQMLMVRSNSVLFIEFILLCCVFSLLYLYEFVDTAKGVT